MLSASLVQTPSAPTPAGMAPQKRTRWGACTLGAEEKDKSTPHTQSPNESCCCALNPTVEVCSASLSPAALKRGWARAWDRWGSPNVETSPPLLFERRSGVWWVRRKRDRDDSAQRSSVHALGAPGPGRAIGALLEKTASRGGETGRGWCSGEHMATGFVGASLLSRVTFRLSYFGQRRAWVVGPSSR